MDPRVRKDDDYGVPYGRFTQFPSFPSCSSCRLPLSTDIGRYIHCELCAFARVLLYFSSRAEKHLVRRVIRLFAVHILQLAHVQIEIDALLRRNLNARKHAAVI